MYEFERNIISKSLETKLIKPFVFNEKFWLKRFTKSIFKNNSFVLNWINGQYALGLMSNKNEYSYQLLLNFYKKVYQDAIKQNNIFCNTHQYIHAAILFDLNNLITDKTIKDLCTLSLKNINNLTSKNEIISYWKDEDVFYVDSLGMVVDYLFKIGKKDAIYTHIAEKQLDFAIEKAEINSSKLPFHMYNLNNNEYYGSQYWGRGIGWYLLGLMYGTKYNPEKYSNVFSNLINYVISNVSTEGYLYDNFKFKNHIDTSITSMAAIAINFAIENNIISSDNITVLRKMTSALINSIDKTGGVINCSGECKGANKYSKKFGDYFAGGYTLMLLNLIDCSETINLKNP